MPPKADFDVAAAHKFFAADCFNNCWSLIDKKTRTDEDDAQMVHMAHASVHHWLQREDCKPQNLSVGYWQLSRVLALVNAPDGARLYGQMSLDYAKDEPPFFKGYAYEALARAEMAAGDKTKMTEYLEKAKAEASQVDDKDSKKWLEDDLATIG